MSVTPLKPIELPPLSNIVPINKSGNEKPEVINQDGKSKTPISDISDMIIMQQAMFDELKVATENLLHLEPPFMGGIRTVRRCSECLRWIRFCNDTYTICGSCQDDLNSLRDDREDHEYCFKKVILKELLGQETIYRIYGSNWLNVPNENQ